MRRASLLLGLFAILTLWLCHVGAVRARTQRGCHIAHWENWTSEDEDSNLECFDPFDSGDASTANAAISQITNSGYCATLKALLQNSPGSLNEWTGYWYEEYWWDAATNDTHYSNGSIGFHHSAKGDSGLWAHEATHFDGTADEAAAQHYQWACLLDLDPGPSPIPTGMVNVEGKR